MSANPWELLGRERKVTKLVAYLESVFRSDDWDELLDSLEQLLPGEFWDICTEKAELKHAPSEKTKVEVRKELRRRASHPDATRRKASAASSVTTFPERTTSCALDQAGVNGASVTQPARSQGRHAADSGSAAL